MCSPTWNRCCAGRIAWASPPPTWNLPCPERKLNVAVTVSALSHAAEGLGYVLVFEDLSDLLRAQKQAAWREVARRVAHEIKNPLTPIALSAERIHRHLARGSAPDAASLEVIRDLRGNHPECGRNRAHAGG